MLSHILTTHCNYGCAFCSFADTLNARANELTLDEIERVYRTIGENLNVIVYSGGEPTLRKDLAEIIEAAYRWTPVKSVFVISNAWKPDLILALTHRIKQRCPELHLTWSLSIEGPRSLNNAVRHTHSERWDAWQNTVDTAEGIKAIRRRYGYSQLDVQLCTVCSPNNYTVLDEWYETVRDELEPDKWNLNLMRKSMQMSRHALPSFSARRRENRLEPFEQKYLEITRRLRDDVLSGRLKFAYHTGSRRDGALKSAIDLISQEVNRRTVLDRRAGLRCYAGYTGAYIGSLGEVSGCEEFASNSLANKTFGHLRDYSYDFRAIWQSPAAWEHRRLVNRAPECRGCTLESQRNYPSVPASFGQLFKAALLARKIG